MMVAKALAGVAIQLVDALDYTGRCSPQDSSNEQIRSGQNTTIPSMELADSCERRHNHGATAAISDPGVAGCVHLPTRRSDDVRSRPRGGQV